MADGWEYRRQRMVQTLKQGGTRDERLLDAMASVPRHLFVPEGYRTRAYEADLSINIGEGQTISQARVVAAMTEAAEIQAGDRVLEVGTGSGYQAAILAHLARFVFSVERHPSLARSAQKQLGLLGYLNISIKVMDGTLGWPAQGPYAAILVTAGAPDIPSMLLDQLEDGGRMVIPVGSRSEQNLRVFHRSGDRFHERDLGPACFVPLLGRFGWKE